VRVPSSPGPVLLFFLLLLLASCCKRTMEEALDESGRGIL
jgi:hypothetical protein